MTESDATGVGYYGRAVIAGLSARAVDAIRLRDGQGGRFGERGSLGQRAARRVLRQSSHVRTLQYVDATTLYRSDIYQLAHTHFRRKGRLLQLRAPVSGGVMHWTYPIPARIDNWINIHTVHDTIPLTHPELTSMDRSQLQARLYAIAAATECIATVSRYSRDAILSTLPIEPSRVVNCGSAVVDLCDTAGPPAGFSGGDYLLHVGLVENRKNLERLREAWCRAGRPLPLIVAGPDGDDGPGLRERLVAAGCIVLPFQPRRALVGLIRNARALLLISLEEGFGLPVAEAMSLGTPVVTSDRGALKEVAGSAALFVDPEDVEGIATAITSICRDDALAVRLADAGRVRAGAFTLDAFGARLLELYETLVLSQGIQKRGRLAGDR